MHIFGVKYNTFLLILKEILVNGCREPNTMKLSYKIRSGIFNTKIYAHLNIYKYTASCAAVLGSIPGRLN